MQKTLERRIQKAIMRGTCDLVDWMVNRQGVADYGKRGKVMYGLGGKGGSDLIGILRGPGRFVACEVKTPGWVPRSKKDKERWENQLRYIARVNRSGGLGFVARSVEEVRGEIEKGRR